MGKPLTAFLIVVMVLAGGLALWRLVLRDSNRFDRQNAKSTTGDDHLIIKEWKMQIVLPYRLAGDISYFINDTASRDFGGPIRVDFVSKAFSKGSLQCATNEGSDPRTLVSIYREPEDGSAITHDPEPFKTIDNIRYYFADSTACEKAINASGSIQEKQLLVDLKSAIITTLDRH